MQLLDYPPLHQECKMPFPPKITNKTKNDHKFLYPRDRQHKIVHVTIVDHLVNTFSMEKSVVFYSFFTVFRPSRKLFTDVKLKLCIANPQ